jgi:hypothetical protein
MWMPSTSEEQTMVADQLERMLASPLFSNSKRYPQFLRYVVENTLAGRKDTLKERTLGVEVFGRNPQYDSNNDPVVRITAGEVRKRIAQYYHEASHEQELRIDLSPGSYVPEFYPPSETQSISLEPAIVGSTVPLPKKRISVSRMIVRGGVIAASSAIALLMLAHWRTPPLSAVDQWWQPVLQSSVPVVMSVGTVPDADGKSTAELFRAFQNPQGIMGSPSSWYAQSSQSLGGHVTNSDHVGLIDMIAMERIAALLSIHKQAYRTLSASGTTYDDLRTGPAVLVTGLDNIWSLRVTGPLRFHFDFLPDTEVAVIKDRQNSTNRPWQVDFSQPYLQLTRDYGIIARLRNTNTETPVIIAAGIGSNGTAAAAEFLTTESDLQTLISQLPANWQNRNVEAVIETQVINGQAGPPRVVAVYAW